MSLRSCLRIHISEFFEELAILKSCLTEATKRLISSYGRTGNIILDISSPAYKNESSK
ncbi:hypothetical protein [Acetivibrio cellulolyticus]